MTDTDEARAKAHLEAQIHAAQNVNIDDLDGGDFELADDDMNDPELLAMLGEMGWEDDGGGEEEEEEVDAAAEEDNIDWDERQQEFVKELAASVQDEKSKAIALRSTWVDKAKIHMKRMKKYNAVRMQVAKYSDPLEFMVEYDDIVKGLENFMKANDPASLGDVPPEPLKPQPVAKPSPTQHPVAKPTPAPQPVSNETTPQIRAQRQHLYKKAAITMKRAGNTDMALGYMRTMKEIMALEGEMTLDEFDSSYPAPDFNNLTSPRKAAAPVTRQKTLTKIGLNKQSRKREESEPTTPTEQPPPPTGPPPQQMNAKVRAQYENAMAKLRTQHKECSDRAKAFEASGQKAEHAEWSRHLKRTIDDFNKLKKGLAEKLPSMPLVEAVNRNYHISLVDETIKDDQLVVEVCALKNIKLPSGYRSINGFIEFKLEPKFGEGHTRASEGSTQIEWKGQKVLTFENKRQKSVERNFKMGKFHADLVTKNWLGRATVLGSGMVRIKALLNENNITEICKIKDNNGDKVGDLEVNFRIRKPITGAGETKIVELRHYIIGHLPSPPKAQVRAPEPRTKPATQQPSQNSAAPQPAPSAAAQSSVNPKGKRTEMTLEEALEDPLNPDLYVSGQVMQNEIESLTSQIATASGDKKEDLEFRLDGIQTNLQMLGVQIQSGILSLPDYLEKVKKAVEFDKKLALMLKKSDRKAEAVLVFRRYKAMASEVQAADQM